MVDDDALVDALIADYRKAPLSESDCAMLDYAVKLTVEPWNMSQADVAVLRRAGFDDTAILDMNQVASYYAFANRLADGLGVGLEPIHEGTGTDM